MNRLLDWFNLIYFLCVCVIKHLVFVMWDHNKKDRNQGLKFTKKNLQNMILQMNLSFLLHILLLWLAVQYCSNNTCWKHWWLHLYLCPLKPLNLIQYVAGKGMAFSWFVIWPFLSDAIPACVDSAGISWIYLAGLSGPLQFLTLTNPQKPDHGLTETSNSVALTWLS